MKRKWGSLSLYQKFVLVIILVGLCPMLLLTTVVTNRLYEEYRSSVISSYERAAYYIGETLEQNLDSWNDISKMPYYYSYSNENSAAYNYMAYDNLRRILVAEETPEEKRDAVRQQNMRAFLSTVYNMDSSIAGAYFVGEDEKLRFGYGGGNTYLDWEAFEAGVELGSLNREAHNMILIPTHANTYYHGRNIKVFTIARNYYDLTRTISDQPYLGTMLVDVDMDAIAKLFSGVEFGENAQIYVYDASGACFYSNQPEAVGVKVAEEILHPQGEDPLILHIPANEYGLSICVRLDQTAVYGRVQAVRNLMYLILVLSILILLLASVWFSRRLTRPIRSMMEEMSRLESGDFNVSLPVHGNDEIGVLSQRFNEMSQELEKYINQSYVARIKQNEAEMTALKSQIYPHFLYNTLEVIRMTALEEQDGKKAAKMIAALSTQIRYMIGTVQDMVPVTKELEIVEKYIYLLNCRINGQIRLTVNVGGYGNVRVPKLILQPIVENAYVHGLKPRGGSGNISIRIRKEEENLGIAVMDDGVGMDRAAAARLEALMKSDAIGIKCEDGWQSIGLKNVHDRIYYLYGAPYGICFTSQPGIGTMVKLTMPFHGEEDISE